MKFKTWIILILLQICSISTLLGQDDFVVGMFGAHFLERPSHNCRGFYTSLKSVNGFNTSTLNVFKEDGFNIYQTYFPNEWTSEKELVDMLFLTKNNGILVELGAIHFFQPDVDESNQYLGGGRNNFNNCGVKLDFCDRPFDKKYFRTNNQDFIERIFSTDFFSGTIWGFHVTEEASYFQNRHFAKDCIGNGWKDPRYFIQVEIPPLNVQNALKFYKQEFEKRGVTHIKTVVMEAHHHRNINENTNDREGEFNPQDYIKLLDRNDNRDIFFEGSYTQFPDKDWINQDYSSMFSDGYHYLGPFKSIDFAKKHTKHVHKVINVEGTYKSANYDMHYHSDRKIHNANWLWFQTFTSIIHGVEGVWFWDYNHVWSFCEKLNLLQENFNISKTAILKEVRNFCDDPNLNINEDQLNCSNESKIQCQGRERVINSVLETVSDRLYKQQESRFERENFPSNYNLFISELSKQLRYLVNNGFLSNEEESVVTTKTDFIDPNCILVSADNYIPSYLPIEKQNENYGIRYTIRTNGEEYIMILTNPLNVPLNVRLHLNKLSIPEIRNVKTVKVIFEDLENSVYSYKYKTNRKGTVDLDQNIIQKSYELFVNENQTLDMAFGPLDVKILYFSKNAIQNNLNSEQMEVTDGCEPRIILFPNPNNGLLKLESEIGIELIQIYDIQGKEILTKNYFNHYETQVDLSSIKSQIIFVRLTSNSGKTWVKKIYLEH